MKNNDPQLSRLTELVKALPVVYGRITLVSGREADFYVDIHRITLHHKTAPLIGHVMVDLLRESSFPTFEVDTVGGLTMGADPAASTMLYVVATQGLDLDALVVRRVAEGHRMKRQVEGPEVMGRRVVVLENVSTVGDSPLQAANALEAAGTKVVAVAVIVDRDAGVQQ